VPRAVEANALVLRFETKSEAFLLQNIKDLPSQKMCAPIHIRPALLYLAPLSCKKKFSPPPPHTHPTKEQKTPNKETK